MNPEPSTLPPEPGDRSGRPGAPMDAKVGDPGLSFGEAMRLVHELRVHKLELEMQNEALREARAQAEAGWESYRELYDFAPVGYFTLDLEGRILRTNLEGARLLKTERAKVVGRSLVHFLSAEDQGPFRAFLLQNREGLARPTCEVSLPAEGAAAGRVRLESASTRDPDGLHVVAVDITDLRAAQTLATNLNLELERRVEHRTVQLEAANADMQAFCHMISHELRAPLARMEGFSRLLQKRLLAHEPGSLPHVAERIEASSLRMREVIDSLLKLTRLALEPVNPEAVDLSQLAREVLRTLGGARPVRTTIAEGMLAVGDRRLLELCLRNLLENALKFTSKAEDACVAFGVTSRDHQTTYFVRDNGAGFDPAHAGKLFQAFGRLHHQEDFEGTGLGLCIVAKIIEKHGGRIWGEGAPGEGATFFFTLEPA